MLAQSHVNAKLLTNLWGAFACTVSMCSAWQRRCLLMPACPCASPCALHKHASACVHMQQFNKALGLPVHTTHKPTPAGFARFVKALAKQGIQHTNRHAQLATMVAGGKWWQYEYFLKLQDLPQWLPCFAQVRSVPRARCH